MEKDFLQSDEWRKFQEVAGRRTFLISDDSFHASIIEHELPIVGKYFYIPRGPIVNEQEAVSSEQYLDKLIKLAKENKVGWVRIDVNYKNNNYKIVKAPHDMQPKEVFMIDITKPEEQLQAEMKSKTRYNIRLAEKKGVSVCTITKIQDTITEQNISSNIQNTNYFDKFLKLVKITAKRDGITPHPDEHYRKMFEMIPENILKLYVAEYEGKVIAANLVVFYGDTAIYLHGASDNEHRNVMAPYLLQWQQIRDAKKAGCTKYDFGGIKTGDNNSWAGITKFKTGFSPATKPLEFPGSYDIVINPFKYYAYRAIQKVKSIL